MAEVIQHAIGKKRFGKIQPEIVLTGPRRANPGDLLERVVRSPLAGEEPDASRMGLVRTRTVGRSILLGGCHCWARFQLLPKTSLMRYLFAKQDKKWGIKARIGRLCRQQEAVFIKVLYNDKRNLSIAPRFQHILTKFTKLPIVIDRMEQSSFHTEHLTGFERRQRLLNLVHKQPGIRVPELARILGVSPSTVRNDLTSLQHEQRLVRVRGGAVPADGSRGTIPNFATRARVNQDAKQRIARWASELIRDGDAIFCDASSTVYHVASFLDDRRHLTVLTNGIEIARRLAQNASNKVILIGGLLRSDGAAITRFFRDMPLDDLHIKLALVSCAGFDPNVGLTEDDLDQADLKSKLVMSAQNLVALVDATKFGKVDLAPFARPEQIAHIFTDSELDSNWIQELQHSSIALTVCGEEQVSTITPTQPARRHLKIGFANLTEELTFSMDVRRGLERAAHDAGDIDLVVADNQLDGHVAFAVAERFLNEHVDLMIEYQIDEKTGNVIMARFREQDIPVIAVDIPMVGATYFGVDNYHAGFLAGQALGEWIVANWNQRFDRLIVLEEQRAGALVAGRIRGQLDGFQSIVGEIPSDRILYIDCGNRTEVSEQQMTATMNALQRVHRLAVIAFNDDAALGALAAARALGRENDVVIVGQGADRPARAELRRLHSRFIGSTAYMPEKYGEHLIMLAQSILRGEPLPPAIYMEHTFITRDNIDTLYPE